MALCIGQTLVFTSQEKENHEVGGSLELGDVLLPLPIHSVSHHLQQTLHQARLHQLQLYHIWQWKEGKRFTENYGEQFEILKV